VSSCDPLSLYLHIIGVAFGAEQLLAFCRSDLRYRCGTAASESIGRLAGENSGDCDPDMGELGRVRGRRRAGVDGFYGVSSVGRLLDHLRCEQLRQSRPKYRGNDQQNQHRMIIVVIAASGGLSTISAASFDLAIVVKFTARFGRVGGLRS